MAACAYMPVPMSVAETPTRPGASAVPVIEASPLSACTEQIVGAPILVGAVLAVARDVDGDQALVPGPHGSRAEARAFGGAGRQVLDQHVGPGDQAMQQRQVTLVLEVECD